MTKKYVADVENVEFSNPELVWVEKVNEVTPVGELKAVNRLKVEYSAELTEDKISEINSQTFSGTNATDVRDWINSNGDQNQVDEKAQKGRSKKK